MCDETSASNGTQESQVSRIVGASPWPERSQLEQWLMNTAKDGDESAAFLRKVLQMNPAYGVFLAGDTSLAGIVQVFAKRLRSKILGSDSPLQRLRDDTSAKLLFEPLCEISWRVVGHVLHGILELEDTENYPVPKEAIGQVRMLLDTNVELSKKFNEMRRAYLRELCILRDKQRIITEKSQAAVNSLQEDPVMFYEPLEFILDDTTKAFINEVIEERLKLGMRAERNTRDTDTVVEPLDREDPEKAKMAAELRQLRAAAAREQAAVEKAREEAARYKLQLEKLMAQLQQKEEDAEKLRKSVEALTQQRNELSKQLKSAGDNEIPVQVVEPTRVEVTKEVFIDNSDKFEGALREKDEEIAKLRQMIQTLEKEKKDQARELELALQQIEELENKPQQTSKKPVAKAKQEEEPVKKVKAPKDNALEDLKRQLEEALRVEKELRAANRSLEKALQELKEKPKYRGPSGDGRNVDEEIEKAIAAITEQHRKKIMEKDEEISRLEELLAQKKTKKEPAPKEEEPEKKPKKVKEVVAVEGDGEKVKEWKRKFGELQDKYDELEHENEKLQHQIRILLDKIKKYGGEQALAEVMAEVKITALPPRKKRKKKAWERLYEDAQRRILDMQKRRAELEKQEKKILINVASRVRDRKSLRQVENLNHLHKASVATQNRFHDALKSFHHQFSGAPTPIAEGADESSADEIDGYSRSFQRDRSASPTSREIEALLAENKLLSQEVARLRKLVPGWVGATGDASFFGLSSTPIRSLAYLGFAEVGMKPALAMSTSGPWHVPRARRPSESGSSRESSRSLSPPALSRMGGRELPAGDGMTFSRPIFGAISGSDGVVNPGTREAQLCGIRRSRGTRGSRSASPIGSSRSGDTSSRFLNAPAPTVTTGAATAPILSPWRQNTFAAGTAKATPALSLTRSEPCLTGGLPFINHGAVPWRAEADRSSRRLFQSAPDPHTVPAPPPVPASTSAPASGPPSVCAMTRRPICTELMAGPPKTRGRTVSAGTLDPLERPSGKSIATAITPATSYEIPTTTQAEAMTGPPAVKADGSSQEHKLAASPKQAPVKPKASGLCVTALRSQESLGRL